MTFALAARGVLIGLVVGCSVSGCWMLVGYWIESRAGRDKVPSPMKGKRE